MSKPIFSEEEVAEYAKFCQEKITILKTELANKKIWTNADSKKKLGIFAYRRDYMEQWRMYFAEVHIKGITPREYWGIEKKALYEGDEKTLASKDKRCKFFRILEKYNDTHRLTLNAGKSGVAGTKDREFLCMNYDELSDDEIFGLTHSCFEKHDERVHCDRKNKRGMMCTGFWVRKKGNGCHLIFFNFVHPRGQISSRLMNIGMLVATMGVAKRAKKMEK